VERKYATENRHEKDVSGSCDDNQESSPVDFSIDNGNAEKTGTYDEND
jgi:hypothetical protein